MPSETTIIEVIDGSCGFSRFYPMQPFNHNSISFSLISMDTAIVSQDYKRITIYRTMRLQSIKLQLDPYYYSFINCACTHACMHAYIRIYIYICVADFFLIVQCIIIN